MYVCMYYVEAGARVNANEWCPFDLSILDLELRMRILHARTTFSFFFFVFPLAFGRFLLLFSAVSSPADRVRDAEEWSLASKKQD